MPPTTTTAASFLTSLSKIYTSYYCCCTQTYTWYIHLKRSCGVQSRCNHQSGSDVFLGLCRTAAVPTSIYIIPVVVYRSKFEDPAALSCHFFMRCEEQSRCCGKPAASQPTAVGPYRYRAKGNALNPESECSACVFA